MDGLTEGRMVHYVLQEGRAVGEHRPAVVVKVWRVQTYKKNDTGEYIFDDKGFYVPDRLVPPENGSANLHVFTDGINDYGDERAQVGLWATSVLYDESGKPGTWHWIERA